MTPNSPRVTWPEQTNNIAGCKTPPRSPSTSPLQKKSIGTGSKFPLYALGWVEGRNPLLCVYSLSAISELLIIREMSAWYCYVYGNYSQSKCNDDFSLSNNRRVAVSYHGGVKRDMSLNCVLKKKRQPCFVATLYFGFVWVWFNIRCGSCIKKCGWWQLAAEDAALCLLILLLLSFVCSFVFVFG